MRKSIIQKVNQIFPDLKSRGFKGQNGRIAVVGGSYQFSGAPFYSAISALKTGGDLAHIFCSKSSSMSIKSYSPQIIVHPVFVSDQEIMYSQQQKKKRMEEWLQKIKSWQRAIHAWVIGPGLGRCSYMQQFFPQLLKTITKNKIVIFDADGIYYLSQNPQLFYILKDFRAILTPNHRELSYIKPYLNTDLQEVFKYSKKAQQIQLLPQRFNKMHNFSLLIKGQEDIILGEQSFIIGTDGGLKRCGGIGDILAGVTAVCSFWNYQLGPVLASRIVKIATRLAFEKQGRSLTAPSVIKELSNAIKMIQNEKFDL